jgi:Na+-driven multidrug efflux pump
LGKNLIIALAFVHLFDGTQCFFSAILRAVGSQLFTSITMFIGFYVIGTPIGMSFLFLTDLKIYGWFSNFSSNVIGANWLINI